METLGGDYPFRTDPMGDDKALPTFDGPSDFSERADDYMTEFGNGHAPVREV